MQQNSQNKAFDDIQKDYGVGEYFFKHYAGQWFGTENVSQEQLNKVRNNPLTNTWFSYGLSTNQRGRWFAQCMLQYMSKNPKRYLDVGCGYGGFMVAFHEIGLDVYGFDLDSRLVAFSKSNLKDFGVDSGRVQIGDILNTEFLAHLKTFDIITANDVIEHVNDVDLALKHMAGLLNPSGILLLQIPNKDYVGFISKDGHYHLFGITLLRRKDAKKYYQMVFGDDYTVGEYYEIDYYINKLSQYNCYATLLPPIYAQKGIVPILMGFLITFPGLIYFWLKSNKPVFSMKLLVTVNYFGYVIAFLVDGFLSLLSKEKKEAFRIKYTRDFWLIMATKRQ